MKNGFKVFVNLALLAALAVPVFSQPSSKSVETFTIDNFDAEADWKWVVNASRFVAEGYPKFGYFAGIPNSLKPFYKGTEVEPKVFGVNTAFNRKGDNWFEILPTKDGKPYEYPFIGTVDHIDFWAWGANYRYYLEIMLRDAEGSVHILPCGDMHFSGWKNIIVKVPGWINQHSRLRSGPESMTFVGFRVRSDATEFVDDFTIYFDQLKYMSNSLSYIYDGYELKESSFESAESGSYTGSSSSNKTESSSEAEAK